MNKPLRRIAIFCGFLVLALLVRANWLQYFQADELNENDRNRRIEIDRYASERGNIIVDSKPITGSKKTDDTDFVFKRTYVNGPMWAPVTGYASQAFGANQIENLEDGILSGNSDQLFFDRTMAMFTGDKKKGGNVVTTLNGRAQKAAFEGLGKKKGAVAALDPGSGKILALASTPSYDPADFAGYRSADAKAYKKLDTDKDKPMLNRALREIYPPGSTFKVLTAAAALEHGKVTDVDEPTDTPEPYILPNTRTPMTNLAQGCENVSLKKALEISCNSVFAKLADEVGREKMLETAEKFGFNKEHFTPVRAAASVYDKEMERSENSLSAIGQFNTATTPLQMAMVAAGIANDGKLMKPYMIDRLESPDLDVIKQNEPEELSRPLSQDTAQRVQELMENVVDSGSGRNAQIPGVKVGGKTGTAQHGANNSKRPYAWFISYAKTDEGSPVAVAVIVEDAGGTARDDISGGGLAAPIAKKVMEAVLKK
ncbi:penicillin-binding transpeptidase domain-containing protein [Streptomyces sp. NPDC000594]|uniref:peptidoglycan D,D-transpeptidase FtsI family protein n=1 Tax=Streptomyces sp. NPDC000594 TaxID=3154261 RepID=UPI00331FC941